MITFEQFIVEQQNQVPLYPPNPEIFRGQCYQLFNFYNRDVVGAPDYLAPLAHQIYTNFENSPLAPFYDKIEYSSGASPERGCVVIWSPELPGTDGAGHVGMCTVPGVIIFESFDSNWGGKHAHLVEHDFSYVLGWLRPKGVRKMQQEAAEKLVSYTYRGMTDNDPQQPQAEYWVARIRDNPDTAWELAYALYLENEAMRKAPAKVAELSKALSTYQAANGDASKWQTLKALIRELIAK
jgi:hypothetical protein